jgi:hypothetical protein
VFSDAVKLYPLLHVNLEHRREQVLQWLREILFEAAVFTGMLL